MGKKSLHINRNVSSHARIKIQKGCGKDKIRPEMFKTLNGETVRWLTRMCQLAWKFGKTPKDWQTNAIIPIYKKGDCKSARVIKEYHLLAFQERCMPKRFKKKCQIIVESKLEDGQCEFRPGGSTTD